MMVRFIIHYRHGALSGLLLAALACSVQDGVLGGLRAGSAGSVGLQGVAGAEAGGARSADSFPAADCSLTSPRITLTGDEAEFDTCTGRIAAWTFSNALCVCGEVQIGDFLKTQGFDSTQGEYVTDQSDGGAAVGINGEYDTLAGYTDVGGSLSIAGSSDLRIVGYLATRGDLRLAGNVTVAGSASIARNAWFSGSYVGVGPLSVSGELHHARTVLAVPVSSVNDSLEPVSIAAPCPCNPEQLVRIDQLVDQVRLDNDNGAHAIDSSALAAVSGEAELSLPCGRFYLSKIEGFGRVVLRANAMTALFVDGSIALDGALNVEVAPGAELDIFVRGNLATLSPLSLSTKQRPAATRIFVAGSNDITLYSPLLGNLYAPNARVVAAGALEVYGSIFARSFAGAAFASFVYDRAVYQAGRICTTERAPAGTCSTCGTCSGGLACVAGTCGACRADADCCGQTVCANGGCAPLLGLLQ